MLKEILIQCHGNQTKAAEIVGLNRGNFRETIIQHKLHKEVN
ncbi:helix-turn-helix domain-containing protein [Acinetobacter sp. ANC 3781]|nr:helix-turn-helix domain-containing protein [Acinetobacter sp. ANC 3781]